ncbi:hypothetical protein WJX73_003002 [Symbiochloris irregularis]|uniref:N-acetyltransferase domain-containing protein n=1 Tax=Symbiochloris irregularis TaxID=706552 RepID=A0AAW1P1X4_9CHLO
MTDLEGSTGSTQRPGSQSAPASGGLQSAIANLGVPAAPQKPLVVEAHDSNGALIAGVYGYLSVGWLVVQMLWVHEAHRKQGHARTVLAQLEEQALADGVHRARLDLVGNSAAVAFYERRGYSIYTTLPVTLPNGEEDINYFLKKDLINLDLEQSESSVA